jgi:hypothetical protein
MPSEELTMESPAKKQIDLSWLKPWAPFRAKMVGESTPDYSVAKMLYDEDEVSKMKAEYLLAQAPSGSALE